ncbi:MAG TPA: hypothetical protein VMM60_09470, partial [Ilumatobacter sp.]|nr:hypothetical protein [Ilumatobacter sp.]
MNPSELDQYAADARKWLDQNAKPRNPVDRWGVGRLDVSVFHDLTDEQEQGMLTELSAWQQRKCDAGYGAIDWKPEFGGSGLTAAHAEAFAKIEAEYETPAPHETFGVTR